MTPHLHAYEAAVYNRDRHACMRDSYSDKIVLHVFFCSSSKGSVQYDPGDCSSFTGHGHQDILFYFNEAGVLKESRSRVTARYSVKFKCTSRCPISTSAKKANPLNRYFPVSTERLPLSGLPRLRSHQGYPPHTSRRLHGFKRVHRCVFVTRFSQVPGLTLFVSCSRSLLPLLSPSSTSPAGQHSSRCAAHAAGACRLSAGCHRVLKPARSPSPCSTHEAQRLTVYYIWTNTSSLPTDTRD